MVNQMERLTNWSMRMTAVGTGAKVAKCGKKTNPVAGTREAIVLSDEYNRVRNQVWLSARQQATTVAS